MPTGSHWRGPDGYGNFGLVTTPGHKGPLAAPVQCYRDDAWAAPFGLALVVTAYRLTMSSLGIMSVYARLWGGLKVKSTFADLDLRVAGIAVAGRPARCRGRAERGG